MDATMMKAQTLNVLKIVIFIFWDFHLMMNYGFWIKRFGFWILKKMKMKVRNRLLDFIDFYGFY